MSSHKTGPAASPNVTTKRADKTCEEENIVPIIAFLPDDTFFDTK
jgi:hypothetical protein